MRLFWLAIGVLVAATAVVVALGRGGSSITLTGPSVAVNSPPPPSGPAPAVEAASPTPPPASPPPPSAPLSAPLASEPEPEASKALPGGTAPAASPAGDAEPAPAPEEKPVDAGEAEAALAELAKAATAPIEAKPETKEAEASGGKPFAFPADPAFPAEKLVPSKAVQREDGSLLIDDRFVVKGAGTKEDPVRAPWELLVSAQEVYKPRMNQKRIPQRVAYLNGKYVKLTGFVAFPLASNNPRECLVMLNQWDGCCIGVPPTAYDAVEVKLARPATGDQRLTFHGTLEGKFKVDPYEEGGWLIGLYLMDDATLKGDQ